MKLKNQEINLGNVPQKNERKKRRDRRREKKKSCGGKMVGKRAKFPEVRSLRPTSRRCKGRRFLRQWDGVEVILTIRTGDRIPVSREGRIEHHKSIFANPQRIRDITSGYFFVGVGDVMYRAVYSIPTKGIVEGSESREGFTCSVIDMKQDSVRNYVRTPAEIKRR